MKAILQSYYRKEGGKIIFVFTVTGTKEELAAYKAAQKDNYRENDDKVPMWFTTQSNGCKRGQSVDLLITQNNNVVVDDLDRIVGEEQLVNTVILKEKAKHLAHQAIYGGNVDANALIGNDD